MAYPGTVSLQLKTYLSLVRDVLDSIVAHGFKRIRIVDGHGGNQPTTNLVQINTRCMWVKRAISTWSNTK